MTNRKVDMNAEVRNIVNPTAIQEAVDAAMQGYLAKNPEATSADLALKEAEIRGNIAMSRVKDKFLNSKQNRAARKAHVEEAMRRHDLKCVVIGETVTISTDIHSVWSKLDPVTRLMSLLFGIDTFDKKIVRDVTFMMKRDHVDPDGNVKIMYSLSAQNPMDDKDSLVGREYAVARFEANMTRAVWLPKLLDDQSLASIASALLDEDVVQVYTKLYSDVMQTSAAQEQPAQAEQ
jgi:hypothetical protein